MAHCGFIQRLGFTPSPFVEGNALADREAAASCGDWDSLPVPSLRESQRLPVRLRARCDWDSLPVPSLRARRVYPVVVAVLERLGFTPSPFVEGRRKSSCRRWSMDATGIHSQSLR